MTEPTLTLTLAATAAALDDARVLLTGAAPAELPSAWRTLLDAGWARLAILLRTSDTAAYHADARLVVRLSRAGCHAAMAAVRGVGPAHEYPWRQVQTAHRRAWTALAIGWPAARVRYLPPSERANLAPTHLPPTTTDTAEYYLSLLLQDPRGVTWTAAQAALTGIPAGVWIEGVSS